MSKLWKKLNEHKGYHTELGDIGYVEVPNRSILENIKETAGVIGGGIVFYGGIYLILRHMGFTFWPTH